MILLLITAIIASFSFTTVKAEKLVTQQDTTKLVKRLSIKKMGGEMKAIDLNADKVQKKEKAIKDTVDSKRPSATQGQQESGKSTTEKKSNIAGNTASYPGGEKALREYVRKSTNYPAECKEQRLAGKAIVSVTIMPDGKLKDVKIERSSGNRHMDAEALRVVNQMPKWTPVKDMDKGKETTTHIPVNFRPGR